MSQNDNARGEIKATECSGMFKDVQPGSRPALTECSAVFKNVQQRSDSFTQNELEQTKPNLGKLPNPELTPRQLAAARMLLQGMQPAAVAVELSTTHQTINRWQRLPEFGAELRRLHEMLATAAPSTPAPRSRRRAPSRAASMLDANDQEQRDFERAMDTLLAPPRAR